MSDTRDLLLKHLVEAVEIHLRRFDERTGRFLTPPDGPIAPGAGPEDIGWCPTNQDVIYHLATVYHESVSPYCGDPRVFDITCRAGDAIRDFQYPDGQVEFLKADGSKWGPTYMCWTNYAWLEAYALLRDDLDSGRRRRWEEGLTLAHDGQAREIANGRVHNIPAWKAMSCYRAGQIFEREDWRQVGAEMLHRVTAAQNEGGYWPEHGGPSTLYNSVYVHALGLYYFHSHDESVLSPLRSATKFHQTFTYPDGRVVETVDGRVKYSDRIAQFAWPGFSLFPRGRSLLRHLVECFDPARDAHSPQGGCLASAFHYCLDGPEEPCILDRSSFTHRYRDWAITARRGPWFACLSAFVSPPVDSRWGQDRQNFVSLWHQDVGLIIGGGNSRIQPEWSTFIAGGRYLPDSGKLSQDGTGIVLEYGQVTCTLMLEMTDEEARLAARAENGAAVHNLVLPLKQGERLQTEAGMDLTLDDMALALDPSRIGAWLQVGSCRITVPRATRLHWPSYPYNPYAIDAAPKSNSGAAILSATLDNSEITWAIRR